MQEACKAHIHVCVIFSVWVANAEDRTRSGHKLCLLKNRFSASTVKHSVSERRKTHPGLDGGFDIDVLCLQLSSRSMKTNADTYFHASVHFPSLVFPRSNKASLLLALTFSDTTGSWVTEAPPLLGGWVHRSPWRQLCQLLWPGGEIRERFLSVLYKERVTKHSTDPNTNPFGETLRVWAHTTRTQPPSPTQTSEWSHNICLQRPVHFPQVIPSCIGRNISDLHVFSSVTNQEILAPQLRLSEHDGTKYLYYYLPILSDVQMTRLSPRRNGCFFFCRKEPPVEMSCVLWKHCRCVSTFPMAASPPWLV